MTTRRPGELVSDATPSQSVLGVDRDAPLGAKYAALTRVVNDMVPYAEPETTPGRIGEFDGDYRAPEPGPRPRPATGFGSLTVPRPEF